MKPIRSFLAVAALAACFLPVTAFAAPVSPEVAADLAKGYAAYTGGALLDGRVAAPAGAPRAVTAEVGGEEVVLAWAFDMEPQGWILVASADAAYGVYASDTVDGTYSRVSATQRRSGGLLTFEIPVSSSSGTKFFQIKASATESDLP